MKSGTPKIPNRFHFVFGLQEQNAPFHLVFYLCLKSCLEVNRPDAVHVYYHHLPYGRYWDLIRDRVTPVWIPLDTPVTRYSYRQRKLNQFRYAHESDFIRLEKLFEHGGIYADIDTIFVQPIPNSLREKPFVLGRENDVLDEKSNVLQPSLCNAFIMAERNARFGQIWLERMFANFDGTWSNHSTLFPARLAQAHPELIHIEPQCTFYKHMWTRKGLRDLLEGCDPDIDGVVSMHLWAHMWWRRRRLLRGPGVHADVLTESYIRNADTTYNLLARPYLPEPPIVYVPASEKKKTPPSFKKNVKELLKMVPFLMKIRRKFYRWQMAKADRFLARFFASKQWKIVVQVGANDGVVCDPLRRFLEEPGRYRAILIEPIPYYFEKLRKLYENRGDISVINVAIGAEETEKRMYFIPPDVAQNMNGVGPQDYWAHGQGSFDYETIAYWIRHNSSRGREYRENIPRYMSSIAHLDVPVKPLKNLIPTDGNVLLVVDVQGAEEEVLRGMDWRHPPEYIMLEDDLDQTARSIRLLYYHGYRYVCGTYNKIYRRSARRADGSAATRESSGLLRQLKKRFSSFIFLDWHS